jgi:hypothetical protein
MILKPGKTPTDVASYRSISRLPTTAKVLEEMLLTGLTQESNLQSWLPNQNLVSGGPIQLYNKLIESPPLSLPRSTINNTARQRS